MDGSTVLLVKCLVLLDRLWPYNELPDSIVVETVPVDNNIHQFAVLNTALIRDNLMSCGAEKIAEACNRDPWLVNQTEADRWLDLSHQSRGSWRPKWQLLAETQEGQRLLSRMLQCIRPRRNIRVYDSPRLLHPWQMPTALGLCQLRSFESLQSAIALPSGMEISKRNAQVLFFHPEGHAIGLDSAHYEMLAELHGPVSVPTELFLRASCLRQRTADMDYYVPRNQHLLTCLRYVLEATCLVGARVLTSNHISHISTPRTPPILLWYPRCAGRIGPASARFLDAIAASTNHSLGIRSCSCDLNIAPGPTLAFCSRGIATDQRKACQIGCSDTLKQLSSPLSLVLVRCEMRGAL